MFNREEYDIVSTEELCEGCVFCHENGEECLVRNMDEFICVYRGENCVFVNK
ncbi:MAG: hypothetical protein ACRCZ0_08635 [Cetobacterium sp.]